MLEKFQALFYELDFGIQLIFYLFIHFSDSMNKGEWWRLITSKISFLETKDAIFCFVLIYYFR